MDAAAPAAVEQPDLVGGLRRLGHHRLHHHAHETEQAVAATLDGRPVIVIGYVDEFGIR